jgi:hypothetical protein
MSPTTSVPRSKLILGCFVCALVAPGCASIDQNDFEQEINGLVHDGMPAFEAVPQLQKAGFQCSPDGNNPPAFTCTRLRQPFALYTCVQRVTFVDTLEHHGEIRDLTLHPIACAGL